MKVKSIQHLKAKAFTLAETLIVIGIIGVVAALTLPNLNHATGDKERVTRVKKIYSALTEVFDRSQAVYGDFTYASWFNEDDTMAQRAEKFGKRLTEFMKISKVCGLETAKGCFTSAKSKYLNGSEGSSIDSDNTRYKVVTGDGMSIGFSDKGGGGIGIIVDIDGPNRGSNVYGKDLFRFDINRDADTLYPWGKDLINDASYYRYNLYTSDVAATWILNNDNADYLKADLSTGKCNDSDIVLDGVTNTSCH